MARRNFSRIRLARIMAGLTMEEAAKALGYDQTIMLRGIESGKKAVPVSILKQMAELYHCSADFLLGLTPIRQRADEIWTERDDDKAFLNAVNTGAIKVKKPAEYQNNPNYMQVAEDSLQYGYEAKKTAPEETLELLLVKFRSAYPKGKITVDYTGKVTVVTLICETKTGPLMKTAESKDPSSVRVAVCALIQKALEL